MKSSDFLDFILLLLVYAALEEYEMNYMRRRRILTFLIHLAYTTHSISSDEEWEAPLEITTTTNRT